MYSWVEFALGHGIVGGDMLSPAILARRASEVVLRVLAGEKPEHVPVAGVDSTVVVVDWRQLRRWHISEDNWHRLEVRQSSESPAFWNNTRRTSSERFPSSACRRRSLSGCSSSARDGVGWKCNCGTAAPRSGPVTTK